LTWIAQFKERVYNNEEVCTMNSKASTGFAFLAGLILGGLTGAVVALLFAPQSGEETRRQLQEKGIELRERAETSAAQVRERYEDLAVEVRAKAEEVSERGREILETRKAQLQEAVEEGKKRAETVKEELKGKTAKKTPETTA